MKQYFKIYMFFLFVLGLGSLWGISQKQAYAKTIGVNCCKQCTNYCKCENSEYFTGCFTEECSSTGSCSGVGIKCCWPE